MSVKLPILFRGNYVEGLFSSPEESNGEWVEKSPSDQTVEIIRVRYSYQAIDQAVGAAKRAQPKWAELKTSSRLEVLARYKQALQSRKEELLHAMAFEIGKPIWDGEIEFQSTLQIIDSQIKEAETFDSTGFRPSGAIAVISPFSSPLASVHALFIPALWTGNSILFKPSEKCAWISQVIAECFDQAQIPAGVFNLVQGERELGRRLASHEGIDSVFFAGSYEVGVRIKQDTLQQHWKSLVLLMGAKNPLIVWEDADLQSAVRGTLQSAFQFGGQSCLSASRAIVHRSIFDSFVKALHEKSKAFVIGDPLKNPFLGPLIDHAAVDRYLKFVGTAVREGGELVMRGKRLDSEPNGFHVTPTLCVFRDSNLDAAKKSVFQQTELLAPAISITAVEDWDHAASLANGTQYGWVASIYTQNSKLWDGAKKGLQFGHVHWNQPTWAVDWSGRLGGLKKSGNKAQLGFGSWKVCGSFVSDGQEGYAALPPLK